MLVLNMQQMLGKNCFIREHLLSILHFSIILPIPVQEDLIKTFPLRCQPHQHGRGKKGAFFPDKMNYVQMAVTWEYCIFGEEFNTYLCVAGKK